MTTDSRIKVIKGDITTLDVDAIVNAANRSLMGGGGVDGAIHAAAGSGLLDECLGLRGCETGQSKITSGYNLKARHVIHSVGPIWKGGTSDEDNLLASCYRTSLSLARDNELRTIAFPNISTGIYGFPKELAAFIAVNETIRFLKNNKLPEKVTFVSFSDDDFEIYRKLLEK
jgi:O-acetyl-ADP-ribose deacetylase